ncbi:MAG: lytic transglycosylase domain-containing protein [Vicinamibacterales bacterium]
MALERYQATIAKYAAEFGVPVTWIQAVIMTESSGRSGAYRAEPRINDASYGLMQLLARTARGLGYQGPPEGLYDPDTNIRLGTLLLRQLRDRFGDDFSAVYSAYNSGSPTKWTTSAQVRQHVENARRWLQHFRGPVARQLGRRRGASRRRGGLVADDGA